MFDPQWKLIRRAIVPTTADGPDETRDTQRKERYSLGSSGLGARLTNNEATGESGSWYQSEGAGWAWVAANEAIAKKVVTRAVDPYMLARR